MDKWTIVVILVIFIMFIALLFIFRQGVIAQFGNVDEIGHANEDDPYQYPFIINKFISEEHCKLLMEAVVDKLQDSKVVGGTIKELRNSQQSWIPKTNPLAKEMFEMASKMFNIPVENAEDMQVVRYLPGQYYNEHHDSCCEEGKACRDFIERGGQRKLTILIYLNSDFGEGHTYFPNLGIKIKPAAGDAIAFYPLASNCSKCHPLSLHSGTNVVSGEKWVANLWFRERTFDKKN